MSRPKLLLADDSVAIRKVVELTFVDEGIEVFAVPEAQAAMEKFVEVQPDIVLVDATLDGTSGYQICEMIKADEATRHIPVLLLVGSFEPFDHTAAEQAGADGFMTKPFQSIRELVSRVSELLGRTGESTEPIADRASDVATAETGPVIDEEEPSDDLTSPAVDTYSDENITDPVTAATVPTIDTADIDELYKHSFHETVKIDEFDTLEDVFDTSGTDDELIETSYRGGDISTNGRAEVSGGNHGSDTVNEFDWSPSAMVSEVDASGNQPITPLSNVDVFSPDEVVEGPALPESTYDEASLATGSDQEVVSPGANDQAYEPSAEFIAIVAQRVLERLSDRVVREVAQEAVPRIAEKLIREALDEEKKS